MQIAVLLIVASFTGYCVIYKIASITNCVKYGSPRNNGMRKHNKQITLSLVHGSTSDSCGSYPCFL